MVNFGFTMSALLVILLISPYFQYLSMTDATYEYRDGKNIITLEEEMEL